MRLLNTENKLSVVGGVLGGGLANWLMGINEGTCWDEHCVLYLSNELINSIPQIIIRVCVN